MELKRITCTAPVNIAVIKYWGKRNEDLILPINDSISVTLSSEQMHAKTTVAKSTSFEADRIWLNGKEENICNPRLVNCLREVRKRANVNNNEHVHICSMNNFPTAAGLASSAAGYACLVYALCTLFEIKDDFSEIARQGSGSACRSIYGGFVQWHMGNQENGKDSVASVVENATHWPELRILILVASDEQKKVASSIGMKRSVETSALIHYRAETIVPDRIRRMRKAISDKNFEVFAQLTMEDSNQLHAVCLDTYPPCVYMNTVSHAIVQLVHQYNEIFKSTKACYTFDAGPNACIILPEANLNEFAGLVEAFFPSAKDDYFRGEPIQISTPSKSILEKFTLEVQEPDSLRYAISTKVGTGPEILNDSEHLLNIDGLPKV